MARRFEAQSFRTIALFNKCDIESCAETHTSGHLGVLSGEMIRRNLLGLDGDTCMRLVSYHVMPAC